MVKDSVGKKSEKDVYEVEKIVEKRVEKNQVFYKVKWKNYPDKDNSWVSHKEIYNCKDLINKYESKSQVYQVEKIVGKRIKNGHNEYLVKWEGYDNSQNTWES